MTTQRELWPDAWPAIKRTIKRPYHFDRRRDLYPVDWTELAAELKTMVDYVCQECGRQCRRPGEEWDGDRQRVLGIAHTWPETHDPSAPVVCCAIWCASCHLRFDAERRGYARRWGEPGRMTYGWVQGSLF